MKKRARAKNQHYIPRLHLRRFVGDQPKNMIWTFDNRSEEWRASTVENTGAQANFYSAIGADGEYDDVLDNTLMEIEGRAETGYSALLDGKIPTGQARVDLAVFIAALHCRTPAMINAVASGHAAAADLAFGSILGSRATFEKAAAKYKRDTGEDLGDYDKLKAFHDDKSRYQITVSQKSGLSILGATDRIAPAIHNRTWYLLATLGNKFITSDNPVFRSAPPETVHPIYGDGGFTNLKAEITFPLSPERMLLMYGVDPPLDGEGPHIWLDATDVSKLNEARAHAAERFIYACCRDDEAAALAVKHRDNLQRFQIAAGRELPKIKVKR